MGLNKHGNLILFNTRKLKLDASKKSFVLPSKTETELEKASSIQAMSKNKIDRK